MKKPDLTLDIAKLKDTKSFGEDGFGRKRCCVKTWAHANLNAMECGVVYADEPLSVYVIPLFQNGILPRSKKEVFESVEKMTEKWMVD